MDHFAFLTQYLPCGIELRYNAPPKGISHSMFAVFSNFLFCFIDYVLRFLLSISFSFTIIISVCI